MSAIPTTEIIDAFYLCLAASVVWAPLVFLGAAFLNRRSGGGAEATVWPSALLIAALPVIAAPFAAAFGLTLRAAKPLPPMAAPETAMIAVPASMITAAPQGPAIEMATVLNAVADLYFYGFVLFAALGILRLVGFSYRVRYSYPIDDVRLMDGLRDWRRLIGVRGPVRFAYSDAVTSVCVHGFVRPVVLMPPSLLERVSTDDAILMGAHELAHVKRGDTWLFAFCGLAKALFWFNPFMRRIIAHAQLAAEQAADALVIRSGVNRKSYARCFVESLKITAGLSSPQHALVPSFTPFDKRSRRERLDAILSGRAAAPFITLGGKIVLIASGLLALVLAFGQAALAVAPPPAKDALTVVPVEGRITSTFGERFDPISKEKKFHKGMDIAAATGTPVRAAGDGKVVAATPRYNGSEAWGNVVVIDHGHGLVTRYAQLDSYIVRRGDSVKAGDTIGAVGATGRATGPHLHFEVLADGEHIDPAPIVDPDTPMPPQPRMMRKVELTPIAPAAVVAASPAPAAPPAPDVDIDIVPAPAPAPDIDITIDPAPAPMPAPDVSVMPDPAPVAPAPPVADGLSLGERLEMRLAGRFGEWRANLDETFEGFESFENFEGFAMLDDLEGMVAHFGDMEFDIAEYSEDIEQALHDYGVEFDNWEDLAENFSQFAFVIDGDDLSDEQREAIERAREKMKRTAEKARRDAERQMERAQRAMERTEIDRERMMREIERAERARERAFQRMHRESERRHDERESRAEHMEEMLKLREEALREAADRIARERAELEQMRAELEAEKRKKD